jgi:hypothetical protein
LTCANELFHFVRGVEKEHLMLAAGAEGAETERFKNALHRLLLTRKTHKYASGVST